MKVAGQIKSVFLLWQGSLEVNLSNSDWFFLGRDFAILGNIDPRLFLYGPQANIPYNGTQRLVDKRLILHTRVGTAN